MKKYFYNKTIIVTGASSGLGKSFCEELVEFNVNLILVARRAALLQTTLESLGQMNKNLNHMIYPLDVSNEDKVTKMFSDLSDKKIHVDGLIHCAGVARCDYFDNIESKVFESMMKINYFGTLWMNKSMIHHLKVVRKKPGFICNISSLAGSLGFVGYSAYSPTKFAVAGLSEVLRHEMKPHNIHVSCSMPQDIDTPQYVEENKTKPEPTKKVSGNAKVLPPSLVAKRILKGIKNKEFYITIGIDGWFSFWFPRAFSKITQNIIDYLAK